MPRTSLVLVTPGEARALKLRRRVPGLGERRVRGQAHGFVRVGAAQLRSLCEHSGRRKGVKVKVGGKSVRAFPPADPKRSSSRAQLKQLEYELQNAINQSKDDFKGAKATLARDSVPLRKKQQFERDLKRVEEKGEVLKTQIEASKIRAANRMALPMKKPPPQFDEME